MIRADKSDKIITHYIQAPLYIVFGQCDVELKQCYHLIINLLHQYERNAAAYLRVFEEKYTQYSI